MEPTKKLRDLNIRLNKAIADARSISDTTKATGLSPSEVEERWATAEREMDALEAEIASETRAIEEGAADSALADVASERSARLDRAQATLDRPVRSARALSPDDLERSDSLRARGVLASAEYRAQFMRYVRTGNIAEIRAAPLLTTDSNVPVPTDMERRIVELLYPPETLRGLCRQQTIDSKRTIPLEAGIGSGGIVAENGTITPDEFTYSSQISISPYIAYRAISVSKVYLDDSVGGQAYLERRMGVGLGQTVETFLVAGTGSSQPKGLVEWADDANTVVTLATGNATDVDDLDGDDLIDCYFNVPSQYRYGPRQAWVMLDGVLKVIRKLKATTGEYLFKLPEAASDIRLGVPGTILGAPVRVSGAMPALAASKVCVVYGNFEHATIFDRTGVETLVDPFSGSVNLKVNVFAYRRFDFAVENPHAFACIKCSAT